MRKEKQVFVDGFYRPEKEARKLHPEGYDTKYTREVEIPTLWDYVKPVIIKAAVVLTVAAIIIAVAWLQVR